MEEVFERIMFLLRQLREDESHHEFNEWTYRWELDHTSINSYYDTHAVIKVFERKNPIPEHTADLMEYIMSDSTNRHNAMMMAKAWTSNMIPGYKRTISTETFKLLIAVAEIATDSIYTKPNVN